MATPAELTQAYLAYFGRRPDPAGLQFYANTPIADVLAAFSSSPESVALYGSTFGSTQLNALYQALFNRDIEAAGLAYWTGQVTSGALSPAAVALRILQGAQNDDKTAVANKINAANLFVAHLDTAAEVKGYTGNTAAAAARAFLKTVGATASSLATAQGGVDTAVASSTGQPAPVPPDDPAPAPVVPLTFTLAATVETLTGTALADTFNATSATLNAGDVLNGGDGTDTLNYSHTATGAFPAATISNIEIFKVRATVPVDNSAISATTFPGLTTFISDQSTASISIAAGSGLSSGGVYGIVGDGATTAAPDFSFRYVAGAAVATVNISGGILYGSGSLTLAGPDLTSTVVNVAASSVTNLLGTLTPAGTALTINATGSLTTKLLTPGSMTNLTVTGGGVVDLLSGALANTLATIDASAMTGGGLKVLAGNSTTMKFTGGAGDDTYQTGGGGLAAGADVKGGGGTDTLWVSANADLANGSAAFYSGFEILKVDSTITADLAVLAANNSLTGIILIGGATLTNVSAAAAANVKVTSGGTAVLGLINAATNPADVVKIDVNDDQATVTTLSLGAIGLAGVETLQVTATDNVTITSLSNATALTSISFSGAGNVSLTSTVAVNAGTVIDASASTGNLTLTATSSTVNGYTVKGSAGINLIRGGAAPFTVDLAMSTAKADTVFINSATGSTATAFSATVSGFTNATGTGDLLNVPGTATLAVDAANAGTGVADLTASVASGVMTFGGPLAGTATLADKINAAATLAGGVSQKVIGFEDGGNTYIYEERNANTAYDAGTDIVVKLVGVTGVTALSTTASAAHTVWVS